jgi:hypothetical protein
MAANLKSKNERHMCSAILNSKYNLTMRHISQAKVQVALWILYLLPLHGLSGQISRFAMSGRIDGSSLIGTSIDLNYQHQINKHSYHCFGAAVQRFSDRTESYTVLQLRIGAALSNKKKLSNFQCFGELGSAYMITLRDQVPYWELGAPKQYQFGGRIFPGLYARFNIDRRLAEHLIFEMGVGGQWYPQLASVYSLGSSDFRIGLAWAW